VLWDNVAEDVDPLIPAPQMPMTLALSRSSALGLCSPYRDSVGYQTARLWQGTAGGTLLPAKTPSQARPRSRCASPAAASLAGPQQSFAPEPAAAPYVRRRHGGTVSHSPCRPGRAVLGRYFGTTRRTASRRKPAGGRHEAPRRVGKQRRPNGCCVRARAHLLGVVHDLACLGVPGAAGAHCVVRRFCRLALRVTDACRDHARDPLVTKLGTPASARRGDSEQGARRADDELLAVRSCTHQKQPPANVAIASPSPLLDATRPSSASWPASYPNDLGSPRS
jgi:hypothetical protein